MRRLSFLLLLSLLILPVASFAIRFGDIRLYSALFQPLNAEIEVLDLHDISLDNMQVGLASNEDFNRLGLERPTFLRKLKFQIYLKKDGQSVIRVTSNESINEPYLNFLLDLRWSNGRLFRQYTVLLDPLGYGSQPAEESVPPVTEPKFLGGAKRSAYVALSPEIAEILTANATTETTTASQPNETVSESGEQNNVETQASSENTFNIYPMQYPENQTMPPYALVKHSGLPVLSPRVSETAIQNGSLPPPIKLHPTDVGLEQNGVSESGVSTNMPEESNEANNTEKNLRTELTIAAETLNTAKQANQMLQLRLQQLEQQNQAMQAQLQKQSANTVAQQNNTTTIASNGSQQILTGQENSGNTTTIKQLPLSGSAFSGHEDANARWMNWLIIVLLLLAVLSGIGWLWQRGWIQKLLGSDFIDLFKRKLPRHKTKESLTVRIEHQVTHKRNASLTHVIDPIQQADVFITYKRFAQAENALLGAIKQTPQDVRLWLRLFGVYLSSQNREGYEKCLADLPEGLKTTSPALKQRLSHLARDEVWPAPGSTSKLESLTKNQKLE